MLFGDAVGDLPLHLVRDPGKRRQDGLEGPGEQRLEPGVHVSKSGLAGLVADHSGNHRPVDLPADSGDELLGLVGRRGDDDVAGARPHHLEQPVAADAAAHGAHVSVEGAHRHDRLARQAELCRPLGRERAERRVGGEGLRPQRLLQRRKLGVELREKRVRRVPAELGVPEGLVSGGAATPLEPREVTRAGEHRRNPVAMLEDGDRGLRHRGVGLENVNRFGPEPLRRIDPADVFRVVHPAPRPREVIQALGLGDGGVVLPENEHGVRVLGERRAERQGLARAVCQHRGGTGRVHRDATHHGRRRRPRLLGAPPARRLPCFRGSRADVAGTCCRPDRNRAPWPTEGSSSPTCRARFRWSRRRRCCAPSRCRSRSPLHRRCHSWMLSSGCCPSGRLLVTRKWGRPPFHPSLSPRSRSAWSAGSGFENRNPCPRRQRSARRASS